MTDFPRSSVDSCAKLELWRRRAWAPVLARSLAEIRGWGSDGGLCSRRDPAQQPQLRTVPTPRRRGRQQAERGCGHVLVGGHGSAEGLRPALC